MALVIGTWRSDEIWITYNNIKVSGHRPSQVGGTDNYTL